jgi:threonine synthase
MILYSTNHQSPDVSLEEAVFRGLPPDNGLYMPHVIPTLPASFFENIDKMSITDIAFEVSKALLNDDISEFDLKMIVERAIDFDAPVVEIEENTHVLELFHGPSMAFKDFGARFMASLMSYFLQKSQKNIHILVATSGDTGGAVAQGFYKTPGIKVTILYPTGKVSDIQEKQLTTLGENVTALEVDGTFDDCQALVKAAFLDKDLSSTFNFSRLIPQSFYYFNAFAELKRQGNTKPVVFCVPSGNFGNLSAGLIAKRMGLPVKMFVAATNVNNAVPEYLKTGNYSSKTSQETISNAMDVGNPSNFIRMRLLAGDSHEQVVTHITGDFSDDVATREAMKDVFDRTGYVMCPHTAVAYLGLKSYTDTLNEEVAGVVLSTAHYAKFLDVVEDTLGTQVEVPERLSALLSKEKVAIPMNKEFVDFKKYLLS